MAQPGKSNEQMRDCIFQCITSCLPDSLSKEIKHAAVDQVRGLSMQLLVKEKLDLYFQNATELCVCDGVYRGSMVTAYIEKPRTIILAVVQAGNDIANQSIIRKSKAFDKDGRRTVGVITKPDLINWGAEARIALLSKGLDTTKLKLGFYLLKNPTPNELKDGITAGQRETNEMRFFTSSPSDGESRMSECRFVYENVLKRSQQPVSWLVRCRRISISVAISRVPICKYLKCQSALLSHECGQPPISFVFKHAILTVSDLDVGSAMDCMGDCARLYGI
jgi:hypothetical protein